MSFKVVAWSTLVYGLLGCEGTPGPGTGRRAEPAPPFESSEPDAWEWMRGTPLFVDGDRRRGTVYAGDEAGGFLVWNGGQWASHPLPVERRVTSGWIVDATEFFAADEMGQVWHWRAGQWTNVSPPAPVYRLLGRPNGDVYALASATSEPNEWSGPQLLVHEAGEWWQAVEPPDFCLPGADYRIRVDGSIWAGGLVCNEEGTVTGAQFQAFEDGAWVAVGEPIEGAFSATFQDIPGRIVVRASGTLEWNGLSWEPVDVPGYPQGLPPELEGVSDGLGYTVVPRGLGCTTGFRLDDETVFCFGEGRVYHQVGTTWRPREPHPGTLTASEWGQVPPTVWVGNGASHAWGSGPDGTIFRSRPAAGDVLEQYTGTGWTVVDTARVWQIDGAGDHDAWIATAEGLLRYDGELTQQALPGPNDVDVRTVAALGAGRAIAATEEAVYLVDGGDASVIYEPRDPWDIVSVAGSGPDDLWLSQIRISRPSEVEVWHYDGMTWSRAVTDIDLNEYATVMTNADGEVFMGLADRVVRVDTGGSTTSTHPGLYGTLWMGPDAVWHTTPNQVRRHELP